MFAPCCRAVAGSAVSAAVRRRVFSAASAAAPSLVHASPFHVDIPNDVSVGSYVSRDWDIFGDKPALIDGPSGHVMSYRDLGTRIGTVAKGLAAKGVREGDVVGIHLPNCPEYAIAFHAVAAMGGVLTTSNPLYTAHELTHQFRDAGAKYVVTAPHFAGTVRAAAAESGVRDVFVIGEESGAFLAANDGTSKVPSVAMDPKTRLLVLPYSSGTTGLPKGVMLSHYNVLGNVHQCNAHPAMNVGLLPTDVCIGILPFFHIYGMSFVLNSCLRVGATVVTLPRFDPQQFLEALARHKVSYAPVVPPIISFMARHPMVARYDLSAVRVVFSGAAPLDAETQKAVEARLPNARSCQGYGMTEASPVTHIPGPGAIVPGSIGIPVPNTLCKIVHVETGAELPPGPDNTGELCLAGPQIMLGYINNPAATAKTLVKDAAGVTWLHSGDIAWRDEAGNYYVVDRMKELIKHKGFQVAPAELEGILLQHPGVMDVAVVGAADERAGEVPVAFVVRRTRSLGNAPGEQEWLEATAEDIGAWLRTRVAEYKQLAAVHFVDAIPKSTSGKILRRVLKAQLEQAAAADKLAKAAAAATAAVGGKDD